MRGSLTIKRTTNEIQAIHNDLPTQKSPRMKTANYRDFLFRKTSKHKILRILEKQKLNSDW